MVGESSKESLSPEVAIRPSPSDDAPLKYKKFYMDAPSWTFTSRRLKTKNGVVGYYFSHCPVAVFFKDTEDAKEPCYVVFHDEDKPLELEETDEEINFIGTYNIQK